jgi:ABC-type bacteriocin/lantibiotic exporter with double-glycine peptidase domain
MIGNPNAVDIFKRVSNLLKLDKREIGQIYTLAILIGLVNLSIPLGFQSIITLIQSGKVSSSWVILVAMVILGSLIAGIMQVFQLRITENIQQKIFSRSAFDFAYRIPKFKMIEIRKKYAPELVNRFFDTLTIQKGLAKLLIDISTSTLQIIFALILLSLYHPIFILFSFFLILILYFIFRVSGKKGLETSLIESKYKYKTVEWLEEIARARFSFKLAGNSKLHLEKTDKITSEYIKARENHFKVLIFQYLNLVSFKVLIIAGLLIIGGFLVINNEIDLGQFVASEIIILLIMSNVEKLISGLEIIYDVLTSTEKIGQVTDITLDFTDGVGKNELNNYKGAKIEFKNVSFKFKKDGFNILQNINLDIQSNQSICLSGFNHSGKSLLLELMAGIYKPDSGTITLNDYNLENIAHNEFRAIVGNNFKNETIFNGTFIDNITLGRKDISDEDINWAIDNMDLRKIVDELPDGWNTEISPDGVGFSKNTMQKILLCRSIVHKPKLVLLEYSFELFSNDIKVKLLDFLTDKNKPWTVVFVSNDTHVAKACDQVILLENSKIKAEGKFTDLMQDKELKKLFYA